MHLQRALKGRAAFVLAALLVCCACILIAQAVILPKLAKNTTVSSNNGENKVTETVQVSPPDQDRTQIYTVEKGDTLWSIAGVYGVDWKTIAANNGIDDKAGIVVGQQLKIPLQGDRVYTVKPGDTLWKISRQYDINLDSLTAANEVNDCENLGVGTRLIVPSAEEGAVDALAAGRTGDENSPSRGNSAWQWPVSGPVTSPFGPRGDEFHHGLDISADTGTAVYPVRPGKVIFSSWMNNIYGRAVIIDHGGSITSVYAHNSANLVEVGDYVDDTTKIARVGETGNATGPHVHLEVRLDGAPVDPLPYLSK